MMLLGTFRDMKLEPAGPLAEALGEMSRLPTYIHLSFDALDEDEVDQYVRQRLTRATTPSLSRAMYTRTEGNPLYLREVVRLIEDDTRYQNQGQDYSGHLKDIIPQKLKLAIAARLSKLSAKSHKVINIASVFGGEFTLEQLKIISSEAVGPALDEAIDAGIIGPSESTLTGFRFSHALVRDTAYSEIRTTLKAQLHGQVGDILLSVYGAEADSHAAEIAEHFVRAEGGESREKAYRYFHIAGRMAMEVLAIDDARSLFEKALSMKRGAQLCDDTADTLGRLAVAQLESNTLSFWPHLADKALENFCRAFGYFKPRVSLTVR